MNHGKTCLKHSHLSLPLPTKCAFLASAGRTTRITRGGLSASVSFHVALVLQPDYECACL